MLLFRDMRIEQPESPDMVITQPLTTNQGNRLLAKAFNAGVTKGPFASKMRGLIDAGPVSLLPICYLPRLEADGRVSARPKALKPSGFNEFVDGLGRYDQQLRQAGQSTQMLAAAANAIFGVGYDPLGGAVSLTDSVLFSIHTSAPGTLTGLPPNRKYQVPRHAGIDHVGEVVIGVYDVYQTKHMPMSEAFNHAECLVVMPWRVNRTLNADQMMTNVAQLRMLNNFTRKIYCVPSVVWAPQDVVRKMCPQTYWDSMEAFTNSPSKDVLEIGLAEDGISDR